MATRTWAIRSHLAGHLNLLILTLNQLSITSLRQLGMAIRAVTFVVTPVLILGVILVEIYGAFKEMEDRTIITLRINPCVRQFTHRDQGTVD